MTMNVLLALTLLIDFVFVLILKEAAKLKCNIHHEYIYIYSTLKHSLLEVIENRKYDSFLNLQTC